MLDLLERDFWIRMSLIEIETQCKFARISFENLDEKAISGTDLAFSSIHSFLSHSTLISKHLKSSDGSTTIGQILGVPENSIIHNRDPRNHLEHYYEKLKEWTKNKSKTASIAINNLGPKSRLNISNIIIVSNYDPKTYTFTYVDQDIDLSKYMDEIIKIYNLIQKHFSKTP